MGGEGEKEEEIEACDELLPNPNPNPTSSSSEKKEVEVHLFRQGRGPVAIFRSKLGGWDEDLLEVGDILEKYGLKSLFAFDPTPGGKARGVAIRFHPRNGRSLLPYTPGSVVFVDGEPKDPLLKPVTKIFITGAVLTVCVTIFFKEAPEWLKTKVFSGGAFSPWLLACVLIAFTRLRKRTKDILKKYGW